MYLAGHTLFIYFKTVNYFLALLKDAKFKKDTKKTWAELGEITIEGQTDAGQQAEKMIAQAVVELA
jgi:hypothetical protein